MTDYILNGVLGLAVGDALGQPAQGKTRESLKFSPVLEMRQGLWSDDTSLTLCTLASLRENDWRLDYHDLLRRFAKWLEYGYLTPDKQRTAHLFQYAVPQLTPYSPSL